jgi:hypothetical protein
MAARRTPQPRFSHTRTVARQLSQLIVDDRKELNALKRKATPKEKRKLELKIRQLVAVEKRVQELLFGHLHCILSDIPNGGEK